MSTVAPEATIAPHAPSLHLSEMEVRALRSAVRARLDAVRQAELLVLEAKLLVGKAGEAETTVLRGLAVIHGFDPDSDWTLTDDGRLVPQAPA